MKGGFGKKVGKQTQQTGHKIHKQKKTEKYKM